MPNKIRIATTDTANEQTAFNAIEDRCLLYNRTEKALKIKDNSNLIPLNNNQNINCEKLRVRTDFDFTDPRVGQVTAHPEWVANQLLHYCVNGNTIILLHNANLANPVGADSGTSGHIIVTTYFNAFSFDIALYAKNGLKSTEVSNYAIPPKCKICYVKYNDDYWYALKFSRHIYGNIYFTGWTTADYNDEEYSANYSDSDFTVIEEFYNTTEMTSSTYLRDVCFSFYNSSWFFSLNQSESFTEAYNSYSRWDEAPLTLRLKKASEADTGSITLNFANSTTSGDVYSSSVAGKVSHLQNIWANPNKLICLDFSAGYNLSNIQNINLSFDGSQTTLDGLYGIKYPLTDTTWNTLNVEFCSHLKNLQVLSLPKAITTLPNKFCNDNPKLLGIDLPASVTSIPTTGYLFNDCDFFNYIKIENKTNVVFTASNANVAPFTSLVNNLNFMIFVPIEMYAQYISAHSSNGWANHFVPY